MQWLRVLLFPFAIVYGFVVLLRNWAFDIGIVKRKKFSTPILVIGNLNTGGTGKTPMVEWVLHHFSEQYKIAVVSRGYGRKTKGLREVTVQSKPLDVGDEPLQIKQNFPHCAVWVCEKRSVAINQIQNQVDCVVLDDAFQHRWIIPSFSILLTTFNAPFFRDFILPVGNLREWRFGASRAQAIVVTKSPYNLDNKSAVGFQTRLKKYVNTVSFASIGYEASLKNDTNYMTWEALQEKDITLVTGIANPKPLLEMLANKKIKYTHKNFADHHNFTNAEFKQLQACTCIITTQKDYVRLKNNIPQDRLYYIQIKTVFVKGESKLLQEIEAVIKGNSNN